MKALRRSLWLAATLVLCVRPAMAGLDVAVELDCPAEAAAGSEILATVHLENSECGAEASVRLIASIAGNADQSLGGIGIAGPVVAVTVPVLGDDCIGTPGTVDLTDPLPPEIPASLVGTVATFVLITEWDLPGLAPGTSKATRVNQCLVNVLPAP